jgi:hypothetical protein
MKIRFILDIKQALKYVCFIALYQTCMSKIIIQWIVNNE